MELSMATCCAECFQDVTIIEFIGNNHENGKCGSCKKTNAFTIDPSKLAHLFYPFLGLVNESEEDGVTLDKILDNLFEIFNNNVKNQNQLLEKILGHEYSSKKFILKHKFGRNIEEWENFKEELKHENRFFPKNSLYSSLFNTKGADNGDFFQVIEQLKVDYDDSDSFYRARISDLALSKENMGMPPKGTARYGRANPAGISLLYLANNKETCVAEVRPNNTSKIHISELKPNRKIEIIDLTEPRKKLSICSFEDDSFNSVIEIINLLEILSKELSKPVRPESSDIDYLPTQFLCEFIKNFSVCDGIAFESSFRKGKNFVFFKEELFTVSEPATYKVTEIRHDFSEDE